MSISKLPDHLELNLPEGRGLDMRPPLLPIDVFCEWLQTMHEERVRRGVLEATLKDPRRAVPNEPFRLE
jgi:hypothetical protein